MCNFGSFTANKFDSDSTQKVNKYLNCLLRYLFLVGRFREGWQNATREEQHLLLLSLCVSYDLAVNKALIDL